MSSILRPKGRENLPKEILKFGNNLVYSEGTRTEPYYVENIKKLIATKYSCKPSDIHIIPVNKDGDSYNTDGLVKYAFKDVDKRIKSGDNIDHVWIFFDKDDFPKSKFNNANQLIKAKNNSKKLNDYGFHYDIKTGISWHSCWSNEAFELWLTLYFKLDSAKHHRSEYIEYLDSIFGKYHKGDSYQKNLVNIHDKLITCGGSLENAIKYCKKINKNYGNDNPSTGVVEFVEFFKPYFEK